MYRLRRAPIRALPIASALLGLPVAAAAQTTFFVVPGTDPANDDAWEAEVGEFHEFDFDTYPSFGEIDALSADGLVIDVGVDGLGGPGSAATAFYSGNFIWPGRMWNRAIYNRDPASGVQHSQTVFSFSEPVAGFGCWVYDDSTGYRESMRMTVTDALGGVHVSGVLESGNGYAHALEGFLGVTSTVGIARVAVEDLDELTLQPLARAMHIDHVKVAGFPPVVDTDGDGLLDDEEAMVYGTDPLNPDTDGDGLLDGTEVDMAEGLGCPDPLAADSDGDGLSDGLEVTAVQSDPCTADTDADGDPDGADPTPTDPGVPGDFVEAELRALCDALRELDLALVDAPNANAAKGRRNAMCNKVNAAANAVACGEYDEAVLELLSLLEKLDGAPGPPDWMVPSVQRDDLRDELELLVSLLLLL